MELQNLRYFIIIALLASVCRQDLWLVNGPGIAISPLVNWMRDRDATLGPLAEASNSVCFGPKSGCPVWSVSDKS